MTWLVLLACGTSQAPAPATPEAVAEPDGHGDHATMEHRFDDPKKWAAVFDDPERDAWQKPADIVAAMGLSAGDRVADLGAGTGYLVPHLADAVGDGGRVFALDVETALVSHMKQRFAGDARVVARLTPPNEASLGAGEVDHVVLLDVYHHISDRRRYFRELRGTLAPTGRLTVVDFDPAAPGPHGPPAERRISAAQVADELGAAGWVPLPAVEESLEEQFVVTFGVGRANADLDWLALQLDGDLQLIDVRTPSEFAGGHVPGARNVPLNTIDSADLGVDKNEAVVLICQSGSRSARAADQLAAAGYRAINVIGGTGAWVRSGRPVER